MDLYYQWLNAGFRVPITAGTDKMDVDIPVGSNRSYVRIEGEVSYDHWIEGMKKGRGFVTNGPLLTFTVDDYLSGDIVNFQGNKKVRARIHSALCKIGDCSKWSVGRIQTYKRLQERHKYLCS